MTPLARIFEMMTRLGIEPDAGTLARSTLHHAIALRRCENCRCKAACREWLDDMPAAIGFAPSFCMNADIFFELLCDQPGPRGRMS